MQNALIVAPPEQTPGLEGHATRELRRLLRRYWRHEPPEAVSGDSLPRPLEVAPARNLVVLGTRANSAAVRELVASGFLPEPVCPQGYSMRCAEHPRDRRRQVFAVAGADAAGALYALRDLEHYCLRPLSSGGVRLTPFERCDHPRIEYRGHWVWGCNMPDKPAWIENMSRWKLNELIHWDNHPPERAKEYVAFAHERGVRVIWGFGWGWVPDWNFTLPEGFDRGQGEGVEMCGSSEFNQRFLRREIARKVREVYVPTGCDGIYFQAFTECPKCQCPRCASRSMGDLMLRFVNPIVDDLNREFPGLWLACGIHADFGDYAGLKDLDPRCSLIWENCEAGTSIRGPDEDFGYIYKSIPYGHGYSRDCPADPPFTEDSLQEWMQGNAAAYAVGGGIETHRQYAGNLQRWARRFLAKPSSRKHASVVADHSVFCRRMPFPHVALAEAQWNPDADCAATVDGILDSLGLKEEVAHAPDAGRPPRDMGGKPPWLVPETHADREGHAD